MKFKQKKNGHGNTTHYEGEVKLDYVDTDLLVNLPGGGSILIQQRTEGNCVDIILSKDCLVQMHSGDDLEVAKRVLKNTHGQIIFKAKQLIISDLLEEEVPVE